MFAFKSMKSFDVLHRSLNLRQHYLLEASAGTGKTFSIENIVIRLLIEEDPELQETSLLEQILVVTFTRAATRELKARIRNKIEDSLSLLQKSSKEEACDYLQAVMEQGDAQVEKAKRRLEHALATFDQAQIYTIHGFCLRMLTNFLFESDFSMHKGSFKQKSLTKQEVFQLIRDFFRTEIRPHIFSPVQLQIVLQAHGNRLEKVQEALLKYLTKDCEIAATSDFSSDVEKFCNIMRTLKKERGWLPEKMQEDVERQISFYKSIRNKSTSSIYTFIELFRKDSWNADDFDLLLKEGLFICEFFAPNNLNKKKSHSLPKNSSLHYPELVPILTQSLYPLVQQAKSYEFIFARLVFYCRLLMHKYLSEEEKHQENDLLKHMLKAINSPSFAGKVRSLYQAAIIDEFQDTDPVQWKIFNRLFLENSTCKIYLVGDPKQSIYAFRQADIYTYLSAGKSLGLANRASLDTNYRSQPSLVQALNALFKACPGLFSLPSLAEEAYLDYSEVKSSPHIKERKFSDEQGSIHFFQAPSVSKSTQRFPSEECEEKFFFPFMTQEITRLHNLDGFKFNQFAILIKDRFQGQRLAYYFDRHHIPYHLQKQTSLTESIAWESLRELLVGILNPRNENYVKIALGGPILGWNYNEIKKLEDPNFLEHILAEFYAFKRHLSQEGFSTFFQCFMQSTGTMDSLSVAERLMKREGGDIFYDELTQIACLLMEYQNEHPASPEQLIAFLDEYKNMGVEDEERLKKVTDPSREAISILTTHSSKGLEYDIVFAYGVVGRTQSRDRLIPQKEGTSHYLVPCLDKHSASYTKYCEEMDAEKMRQLYVAMTRAKYRLYVPVAVGDKPLEMECGGASPMDIFLARLGQKNCSYQELYRRIKESDGYQLQNFIKAYPEASITYSLLEEAFDEVTPLKSQNIPPLMAPPLVEIPGEKNFIQSFTSLTRYKKALASRDPYSLDLANAVPHNFQAPCKNAHTLPSGNVTGKLLHKILEIIPFSVVNEISSANDLRSWIHPLIQETDYHPWEKVLCEITYEALHIKINEDFCLKDIHPSLLYRETEFLYPSEKEMLVEELQWHTGFFKGVIDLIFFHNHHYYILDWKSNWLGPNIESYDLEKMKAAMEQHDYYFQAHIYCEAVKRYLKLVDKRPFEEIFGGCFYIFLRGLNASAGKPTGVLKI
ncbi:hypothetical protein NEOC84_001106|nr:hypothetical protein [Neochlamydia sp. AcF84]